MPRMVCKGCGKDCKSSILLHLKRLSCRSEYTEEEYNDLKLKAKEVSDLNKKYDPNIKERAKKLRKARYERTKGSKNLQSSPNPRDNSIGKITTQVTNTPSTSKQFLKEKKSEKQIIYDDNFTIKDKEQSSSNEKGNLKKKLALHDDMKMNSDSVCQPYTLKSNENNMNYFTPSLKGIDEINLSENNKQIVQKEKQHTTGTDAIQRKYQIQESLNYMRIDNNSTNETQSTVCNKSPCLLQHHENETINSKMNVLASDDDNHNKEELMLPFIMMLHKTASEKQSCIVNNMNKEMKLITDKPLSNESTKELRNLTTKSQTLIKLINEKCSNTLSKSKEIAISETASQATESITQAYHILFRDMESNYHNLLSTIKNVAKPPFNVTRPSKENKEKEHPCDTDGQNQINNFGTIQKDQPRKNNVTSHDMFNEMKVLISEISNTFKEAYKEKNKHKIIHTKKQLLKHHNQLLKHIIQQKQIMDKNLEEEAEPLSIGINSNKTYECSQINIENLNAQPNISMKRTNFNDIASIEKEHSNHTIDKRASATKSKGTEYVKKSTSSGNRKRTFESTEKTINTSNKSDVSMNRGQATEKLIENPRVIVKNTKTMILLNQQVEKLMRKSNCINIKKIINSIRKLTTPLENELQITKKLRVTEKKFGDITKEQQEAITEADQMKNIMLIKERFEKAFDNIDSLQQSLLEDIATAIDMLIQNSLSTGKTHVSNNKMDTLSPKEEPGKEMSDTNTLLEESVLAPPASPKEENIEAMFSENMIIVSNSMTENNHDGALIQGKSTIPIDSEYDLSSNQNNQLNKSILEMSPSIPPKKSMIKCHLHH